MGLRQLRGENVPGDHCPSVLSQRTTRNNEFRSPLLGRQGVTFMNALCHLPPDHWDERHLFSEGVFELDSAQIGEGGIV